MLHNAKSFNTHFESRNEYTAYNEFFTDLYSVFPNAEIFRSESTGFQVNIRFSRVMYMIIYNYRYEFGESITYGDGQEGYGQLNIETMIAVAELDEQGGMVGIVAPPLNKEYSNAFYQIACNENVLHYNGQTFIGLHVDKELYDGETGEWSFYTEFYGFELFKHDAFSYRLDRYKTDMMTGAITVIKGQPYRPFQYNGHFRYYDLADTMPLEFHSEELDENYNFIDSVPVRTALVWSYGATVAPEQVPFVDEGNEEQPDSLPRQGHYFNIMNLNGMSVAMYIGDLDNSQEENPNDEY